MVKRCDPRAYARCPDRERCGPNIHAYFAEGSECDKFNQKILEAPMTNADRIRTMSDEELAEKMSDALDCSACPIDDCEGVGVRCKKVLLRWLKSPVKEDA